MLPARPLVRALELDIEHSVETGGPIRRHTLRLRLQISRNQASDLLHAIRADTAPSVGPD